MTQSVNESVNESVNHEAVYRTAPATPGLLKIGDILLSKSVLYPFISSFHFLCLLSSHSRVVLGVL